MPAPQNPLSHSQAPGQRLGEPQGSRRGGLLSHPPSLKLDASGEADREINWAFSKPHGRRQASTESAACLLLGATAAAEADGSGCSQRSTRAMTPTALGVLLALLPLTSTLQSQGKAKGMENWGEWGAHGTKRHGATPFQT